MRPISIEVEGKTAESAIQMALKKLKLSRKQTSIEILAEGEKGLFGMPGVKPARVRVTKKQVSKEDK